MEQPKNKPEKISLKDKLISAVISGDLDSTLKALEELNDALIGEGGSYNLSEKYRLDIERLLRTRDTSVKIYLGDGGLSRLFIDKDERGVNIRLGDASTEEVKKKWENIKKETW